MEKKTTFTEIHRQRNEDRRMKEKHRRRNSFSKSQSDSIDGCSLQNSYRLKLEVAPNGVDKSNNGAVHEVAVRAAHIVR